MTRMIWLVALVACGGGRGSAEMTDTAQPTTTPSTSTDSMATGDTAVPTEAVEDRFDASRAVDILFVIDNSCSMSDDQAVLAEGFPQALIAILASGVDFQVGAITTDMDHQAHSGRLLSVNGARFMNADTPDPTRHFEQMATPGDTGSGDERGFDALYSALETHRDGVNAGFLRDHAVLHAVVLSDENDSSTDLVMDVADRPAWFESLKVDPDRASFHALVDDNTSSGPMYGRHYIELAQGTGGAVSNLQTMAAVDYAQLDDVLIPPPLSTLTLSSVAVAGTVELTVEGDGGSEVLTEGVDYTLSADGLSIALIDVQTGRGDEIVVRYHTAL